MFLLAINDLFPVPQVLEEFVSDNPFSSDDFELAETVLSLEGKLSAGFVPATITQTITLLPNSASGAFLFAWVQASRVGRSVYRANGNLTLPSLKTNYTLTNGVLKMGKIMPDSGKILKPVSFKIEWENVAAVGL